MEGGLTALDRRRIKTINLLNMIVGFFLIMGLSNFLFIGPGYPASVNVFFFLLTILSVILSKYHYHALGFVVFTINVNAAIFFINQFYPADAGSYLYYFPLIISVVLLNHPVSLDRFAIIHFVICILFFSTNFFVDFKFIQGSVLSPEKVHVVWLYNLVISAVVTALLSILVTRLIHNQSREIVIQNMNLIRAKEAVDASLKEKEVLLAELHHRVKNNLAIITGLLNLQEDASQGDEARQVLSDSKARIMSMALVHKMLYENPELKNIHFSKYAADLVSELFNSYNLLKKVSLNLICDEIRLPVNKSIPLGLILNEAVTNSIKYVYKSQQTPKPEFNLQIKKVNQLVHLIIKDNGPGFPPGFNPESEHPTLGIYLIKSLTEQIDGTCTFSNDGGAKIEITFDPC